MTGPTIVCVLGMHRSGTSLLAQVLHALGVDLGPDEHLMRPSPANPQGHWENEPITELNDEILARLGGTWSRPPDLPAGWERSPALDDLRVQARELVIQEFGDSECWGFKDPRTCLTLPFWQRILPPMRYLICLRNPVDVAFSLGRRDEEPLAFDRAVLLWLTYLRAALAATTTHTQHMLFYEDLMVEPEPVVRSVADFIGTGDSETARAYTQAAIRIAVSDGLWHHRTVASNVVAERRLPFEVKALYLALRLFVPGSQNVGPEALDLLGAHAAEAGEHHAELERGLHERHDDVHRLMAARADEQRLREEAEAQLLASRAEVRLLKATTRQLQAAARVSGGVQKGLPAGSRDRPHQQLLDDVRQRAGELIPHGSDVLVAAKGDDELLRLDGSRGRHFPMGDDGRYLGYHPAGDTAVIAQLEALRADGADHLLVPAPTLWWLSHYHGLRRHLEDRYVPLLQDERCAIYRLRSEGREHDHGPLAMLKHAVAAVRTRSGSDPSVLDWRTRLGIADRLPELAVFTSPDDGDFLHYLDRSVDVVVLVSDDPALVAEARRVAAQAVIAVDPSFPDAAQIEWISSTQAGWGDDVNVALIPDPGEPAWAATLDAFAETLDAGFAGHLTVVGVPDILERARQAAAPRGLLPRLVEAGADASLAQRASAAAQAGDHSVEVLVTAPAVPLPGWLPAILTLFSRNGDAGVVGTRIVSRLGMLEEAGGVLAADGSPRRRGEGDQDPDRPEYCFVRRVDFCSPPLLATSRDLFERLEGLRNGQVPPGDALVDFSLRAGRAGGAVYYQPQARVVRIGDRPR
jgi:hypothetical protein